MLPKEDQLHQKVIAKIKKDWEANWLESQGQFSETFDIKSQNSFFKSFKELNPTNDISIDSIRRFLKREENKRGFQEQTLDFFAQYLGYGNWEEFKTPKPVEKNLKWHKWGLAFGVATFLGTFVYWQIKKNNEKNSLTALEKVIRLANETQLNAYHKLPEYDTTNLVKYYILGSAAYKDIEKVLVRNSTVRHWTINTPNNPSRYDFLDMRLNYLNDSTAKVTVKEFWHLQYFNAELRDKEEFTYKSTSLCACYFLRKTGSVWKVEDCLYEHDLIQNIGGELKTQRINSEICPCEF